MRFDKCLSDDPEWRNGFARVRVWRLLRILPALLIVICFSGSAFSADEKESSDNESVSISNWLQLGPVQTALPAFHDEKKGKFKLGDLLESPVLNIPDLPSPVQGSSVSFPGQEDRTWKVVEAGGEDATLSLSSDDQGETPQLVWLSARFDVDRWQKSKLTVKSHHLLQVFVDGESIGSKKSATASKEEDDAEGEDDDSEDEEEENKPGSVSKELKLEAGTHMLRIKALRDPKCEQPWFVAASLNGPARPYLGGERALNLEDMLELPSVSTLSLSPDGELLAMGRSRLIPGTDDRDSWLEIRFARDGALERSIRVGKGLSSVRWAPVGRLLSYATYSEEHGTIWVADLESGRTIPLVEHQKDLGGYQWSPDGRFVVFSISKDAEPDKRKVKMLRGLEDRVKGARDRSFLHMALYPSGTRRRLTAGSFSTSAGGISPDGTQVLVTRDYEELSERGYSITELYILDLATLEERLLLSERWLGSVSWSPDGRKLLASGGPSAFDGVGSTVQEGIVPCDYDNQLYFIDPSDGNVEPITREFDPSISGARWSRGDGRIYFAATKEDKRALFIYDPTSQTFEEIQTGPVEVVGNWTLAENGSRIVYQGSGQWVPPRVCTLTPLTGEITVLLEPGKERLSGVRRGSVESFDVELDDGTIIQGRVLLPPGFDKKKTYPALVYYYGGVSPVSRSFGGRYPKEYWASHGYVIYVPQPSGAVGYGQEFSARHVNDWGKRVCDEIIECTTQFLDAHPFVDKDRVGCLGASYGGFMTMLLLTRTDIYAAAISHAGISSISSYWGEGYWGYLYNAVSAADSFPWNRPDVYIDQSPLFAADKVTTPLLLLHGSSDTNVPVGESKQMYAALRILGKDVEMLEVEGQDHWIINMDQRKVWSRTILAWFDRYLKDQPEWWSDLYPDPGEEDEEKDKKNDK